MSRHSVSSLPYANDIIMTGQHYHGSFIRRWLNNDFYNEVFSQSEQSAILNTQVKTSMFNGSAEITGPVRLLLGGMPADYPLTTTDKIYLPWGNLAENMAYWSSGGSTGKEYQVSQPATVKGESSSTANINGRLRTQNYSSSIGSITSPLLFGCCRSGSNLVVNVNTNDKLTDYYTFCQIFPIFKLDPEKIVFAYQIVPADAASPGLHQIKASAAYQVPEAGSAYKLAIFDESVGHVRASAKNSKSKAVGLFTAPSQRDLWKAKRFFQS